MGLNSEERARYAKLINDVEKIEEDIQTWMKKANTNFHASFFTGKAIVVFTLPSSTQKVLHKWS